MSREDISGPTDLEGEKLPRAVDADTLRPPWRKPQMWLLDYTVTEGMNYPHKVGDSESTGYGS